MLGRQDAVGLEQAQNPRIIVRVNHHPDVGVILGRRPQQRRPANVDILDRLGKRAVRAGDRLLKRIQIHDHQIDRLQAVFVHRPDMLGVVPAVQNPGVNTRVQGLDPSV